MSVCPFLHREIKPGGSSSPAIQYQQIFSLTGYFNLFRQSRGSNLLIFMTILRVLRTEYTIMARSPAPGGPRMRDFHESRGWCSYPLMLTPCIRRGIVPKLYVRCQDNFAPRSLSSQVPEMGSSLIFLLFSREEKEAKRDKLGKVNFKHSAELRTLINDL